MGQDRGNSPEKQTATGQPRDADGEQPSVTESEQPRVTDCEQERDGEQPKEMTTGWGETANSPDTQTVTQTANRGKNAIIIDLFSVIYTQGPMQTLLYRHCTCDSSLYVRTAADTIVDNV